MKVPSETALRRRIALWQSRMAPLGIGHWQVVSLHIVPRDEMPRGPAVASVELPSHYDQMRLWFSIDAIEEMSGWDDLDQSIVHELVHVGMRGFDIAIDSAESEFSPAAGEEWSSRIHHERERLVDNLAWTIIHAYRR